MSYFQVIAAIVKKDILMEVRTKQVINAALVFAVLFVVVFSFTMEIGSNMEQKLSGGIFWVSVAFAGILSFNKTIGSETDNGSFEALMLAPVDKSAVFFGKVISNMLFLLLVEVILIPLFLVFYNVFIISHPLMAVVIILSTYAYSLIGTLFSIISVRTSSKEIMMPVLFLPFMVPVIIAAVLATNVFILGGQIQFSYNWIKLTAVFDVIFTAIIYGIFSLIIED